MKTSESSSAVELDVGAISFIQFKNTYSLLFDQVFSSGETVSFLSAYPKLSTIYVTKHKPVPPLGSNTQYQPVSGLRTNLTKVVEEIENNNTIFAITRKGSTVVYMSKIENKKESPKPTATIPAVPAVPVIEKTVMQDAIKSADNIIQQIQQQALNSLTTPMSVEITDTIPSTIATEIQAGTPTPPSLEEAVRTTTFLQEALKTLKEQAKGGPNAIEVNLRVMEMAIQVEAISNKRASQLLEPSPLENIKYNYKSLRAMLQIVD